MRSPVPTAAWFVLAGIVALLLFGTVSGRDGPRPAWAGGSTTLSGPGVFTTTGAEGHPVFVWRWDGTRAQLVGCARIHQLNDTKAVGRWIPGENVE